RRALSGLQGGRADRSHRARRVCAAPGLGRHFGQDPRALDHRPLPRAPPRVLLPQRGRGVSRQRRLDGPQFLPAHRGVLPGARSETEKARRRRIAEDLSRRQRAGVGNGRRGALPAPAAEPRQAGGGAGGPAGSTRRESRRPSLGRLCTSYTTRAMSRHLFAGTARMSTEIELKLSVPAARAGMLWKTRALARLPHAPPMTRRLFSAYYDTKDFALHAAGVTVRLRREAGRWVQTVKGGGEASGGLHSRSESEERVPAQLLNLPALAQAGLGELLERGALHRGLGVVFATQVRRTTTMVEPLPGSRVELSLDRGEIVAGVRREPLCEIELELKSGSTDALFSLASALAHELPLRLDNASKAQRGYRLAIGERATPAKAAPVALPGSATVDEGFRTVAFACLQQLQANESGVLHSPDPEYVHQARVALRRLRSAFTAFSGAVPKDFFSAQFGALRALAATLGEARDWDVFVGQTLRQAAGGGAIPAALARLKRRAAAQRRRARSAAKQALENADYTLLLIDLVRMLHAGDWVRSRTPEQ